MYVMHNVEWNQCNPYTGEPNLLKFCIVPFGNDCFIGNKSKDYVSNNNSYPNHKF